MLKELKLPLILERITIIFSNVAKLGFETPIVETIYKFFGWFAIPQIVTQITEKVYKKSRKGLTQSE